MGIFTYPRSIWTPQPYWARQRNAAGQRIRVDGARMNAEECCCTEPDPCEVCDGSSAPLSVTATIPTISDGPNAALCDAFRDCDLSSGTYVLDRYFFATVGSDCVAQYSLTVTPELFCRNSFGTRDWFVSLWFQWRFISGTTELLLRTIYASTFGTTTPPTPTPNASTPFIDEWEYAQSGLLACSGEDITLATASPDTSYDRCVPSADATVSW